jgi:hypothetical protein
LNGFAASARGTSDADPGVMNDLVFVAITVAFFALAWIYARSFDRL